MKFFWICDQAYEEMSFLSDSKYPLETGGVLAGYIAANGEPVIVRVIGPGPCAVHTPTRFIPDHEWQCLQIDFIFDQTKGSIVYLGDWHTHPDSSPTMSATDHRTLLRIARYPKAGVAKPLMLIGGGSPTNRDWIAHQFNGSRLFGFATRCEDRVAKIFS